MPLRLMFQDEARFGRINDPKICWAPSSVRPKVGHQIVREYTYAYGAVSPKDGTADFLILPYANSETMSLFLKEISKRHGQEFILVVYDGAPCHSKNALTVPDNIAVATLPPYSPELNPVEHVWDEIRETFFDNLVFKSMNAVENQLIEALSYLENNPKLVKSITGFDWIVNHL